MNNKPKIESVSPSYAIPGGEIMIECQGFRPGQGAQGEVFIGDDRCRVVAASSRRILAVVPETAGPENADVQLTVGKAKSEPFPLVIGKLLAADMHIVANPAIDPSDDAIILTRSGSRGQHLPATLFRLEPDGYLDELPDPILNPTGIAFDGEGQMYVTNRAQGEVYAVGREGTSSVYATNLGIATGIAFGPDKMMYVGDRSGTIFRVREFSEVETFTVMEPSVAAYHMAFGPDGRLFLTSPGLASHDAVHVIDHEGFDEKYFRGFGRPQGLAFDTAGNLYVAACYGGHHGVVRIDAGGAAAEMFVAGNNVVGLCFTRGGDMIIATNDSVYSVACGIEGTLLK
jgi:sugar lactone lactonase YvrE